MNKTFTTLIIASLGTILFAVRVHAGSLTFDAAGNLFQGEFPRDRQIHARWQKEPLRRAQLPAEANVLSLPGL